MHGESAKSGNICQKGLMKYGKGNTPFHAWKGVRWREDWAQEHGGHHYKENDLFPHELNTEKYFRNLIKSNRNQIVFTIFRLIWNSKRTLSACVPNQSENGKYNLISVRLNKISKRFLSLRVTEYQDGKIYPDWKILPRLSERLAPLGIIRTNWGLPLNLSISLWYSTVFRGF